MSIEVASEDESASTRRELRLAELVAFGLLVVEGLAILGFLAAGIANQVQSGGVEFGAEGTHVWGYTLALASQWAAPWAVVAFLLGPLALIVWIGKRDDGEVTRARSLLILRLELVLALLTILGGILSIAGRVMQVSPSENWSLFFAVLGIGLGSVLLGTLGVLVVKWVADDLQFELLPRQGGGADAEHDGQLEEEEHG